MASKRQASITSTPGRPVRHQHRDAAEYDDDDVESGDKKRSASSSKRSIVVRKIRLFIQTKLESFRVRAEVTASSGSAGRRELIALFSFLSLSMLVVFALMIWYSLVGNFGASDGGDGGASSIKKKSLSALPKEIEAKIERWQQLGGRQLYDPNDGGGIFPKFKEQPAVKKRSSSSSSGTTSDSSSEEEDDTVVAADIEDEEESTNEANGNGGARVPHGEGWKYSSWTKTWKVKDIEKTGIESEENAVWFSRKSVQNRLDFSKFIDCKREAEEEEENDGNDTKATTRTSFNEGALKLLNALHQEQLAVTQKNYQVHGFNDTDKKRIAELFPPHSPFVVWKKHGPSSRLVQPTCALVGNGGELRKFNYGDAIDSHDLVVRLNQAPTMGHAVWVGRKTTHRALNRLWTRHYTRSPHHIYRGFVMPLERNLRLVTLRSDKDEFTKLHDKVRAERKDVSVTYLTTNPIRHAKFLLEKFREEECVKKHKGPYFGGNVPSTGLAMFMVMSKTCSVVDLYGFGESKSGAEEEDDEKEEDPAAAYKYHYYKTSGNRAVGDDVHCFECERLMLKKMYDENVISGSFCGGSEKQKGDYACGCRKLKCQSRPLVSSPPDNDDENGYCPDKNCRVVDARVALTEDELGRTRREIERNERDSRKKREKNAKVKLAFAAEEREKRTRLEK
jgi:hypothetical protein